MSIFKSTFKPFVVRQINTRQNLLAEEKRPVDFNYYVSSKVPWIRMTSFVDTGEEGKETPDLAKKYILMGGTLYNKKITDPDTDEIIDAYYTRAGIGGRGGAYASDLGNMQYGIRPMPGITGLRTKSLGAYGSLTETTIKFIAWDKKQMEDLSVLFLRPGYKVLVEWGWSAYLETNRYVVNDSYRSRTDSKNRYDAAKKYEVIPSIYNTINCFDTGLDQDAIYEKIDELRYRFCGNYDANLGSIKNFDFTLMPNGSFECTTVLISMGDVIDTIRMNDTIGSKFSESQQTTEISDNTNTEEVKPEEEIKSQFELLMDEYCKLGDSYPRSNSKIIKAIDSKIPLNKVDYVDPFIYKYKEGFLGSYEGLSFDTQQVALGVDKAREYLSRLSEPPIALSKNGQVDKRAHHYIQFAYFLHVLNTYKNLFVKGTDKKVVDIEIPSSPLDPDSIANGLCQASYNSISIDPGVAIIRNGQATLFKDPEGNPGFRPQVFKTETTAQIANPSGRRFVNVDPNMKEYLYPNTNFGTIGNIYINIHEIVSLYKQQSLSNAGYVYVGKLISDILSKIAYSLGSLNDFDKFIKDNKIVIIDKHYTELPEDSSYTSKFMLKIAGNNTTVRSHKIQSKIFPSQASMIAIAAQDRENIAAVQTSTYTYLNKGLKDRLFGNITNDSDDQSADQQEARKSKLQAIISLIDFVNEYIMKNRIQEQYYMSSVTSMNGYLNTLLVELEKGTDYKAVVPIAADLTLDGISGLTIGEIFTLDKKVLPKDYESKAVGFILTGISNEVSTTSWLTTLTTQMCLLDQEDLQLTSKDAADSLLSQLREAKDENRYNSLNSIRYYNILAAFTADVLRGGFKVINIEGEIEKQNINFYIVAATRTYTPGIVNSDDMVVQFSNNYLRLYPAKEGPISESDFQGLRGNRNLVNNMYYGDEYITSIKSIGGAKTSFVGKGNKIISGELPKSDDKSSYIKKEVYVNLKNKEVLSNLIKNFTYYNYMIPEVRSVFDQELNKVLSSNFEKINTQVQQSATAGVGSGAVVNTTQEFLEFRILDPKSVSETTGRIITPIQLYNGYKIDIKEYNKK